MTEGALRYISTRGDAAPRGFIDTVMTGLAEDGGLFVPDHWPRLTPEAWADLADKPYGAIAHAVLSPFVDGAIDSQTLARMIDDAYADFRHPAITPLVQLDDRLWLMELFHGPTLAFKDVALQLLGRLFDHVLSQQQRRISVIGATSGDTGSAAMAACAGLEAVDCFILFPHGRVSEVQCRQMTTMGQANIHALAIDGTFDDCQDIVKALFGDSAFRAEAGLTAVNSINWARIMAQTVYYAVTALRLGAPARPVRFCVPTGNFGNIFAAYGARAMGLPIQHLIVASNRNDILPRFFESARMEMETVSPSLSPSMDIQISSNFERYLFDLLGRDAAATRSALLGFRQSGSFGVTADQLAQARALFSAWRCDDDQTLETIRSEYAATGQILDPHTAVGVYAARQALREDPQAAGPLVSLACAHPAKFPDAVEQAIGQRPGLPPHLADLFDRPEQMHRLPADTGAIMRYIRDHGRAAGADTTRGEVA